ncbi:MAG: DEAD/DEAH box helicase [Mangrovibacterium sp.]
MAQELIIGLVNHRKFGRIFQAFLLEEQGDFYTVVKLVRWRDVEKLSLATEEKELVKLTEKISDEELTKRFSQRMEPTKFINHVDEVFFKNHISPYLDKQLFAIIQILMRGTTRLFSKDDKYSNLYEEDLIRVHPNFLDCRMRFTRTESGITYRLQLYREGESFPLLFRKFQFLVMKPAAFIYRNELHVLQRLESTKMIPFLNKKDVEIPKSSEEKYMESFVKSSIAEHKVKAVGFQLRANRAKPTASLSLEENWQGNLVLMPRFEYGDKHYLANEKTTVDVQLEKIGDDYIFTRTKRDLTWEQQQLTQYVEWGLVENMGSYTLKGSHLLTTNDASLALFDWIDEQEDLLSAHRISYRAGDGAKKYSRLRGELELELSEKDDWFDVHAKVRFGEYEIPFIKLKDHIRTGKRQLELPNGEIAILPEEWFTTYQDLLAVAEMKDGQMCVRKHHYALLQKAQVGLNKEMLARLQALDNTEEQVAVPSRLQAQLRSYQQRGFSWLFQLYTKQFGACLADDMGLGKTLQTIALLLKLKREKSATNWQQPTGEGQMNLFDEIDAVNAELQQTQACSLIVMPTSLLHNWQRELSKFAPDLKVGVHYGAQRKKHRFLQLSNLYDVILTTYGTVRNDVAQMKDFNFFYLILDESQHIKNPESKVYQSIIQLKSQHRLVLTGTPIENSLSDLWAQMNFINPGLLGNFNYFKQMYITPIEKKNSEEQQEKLQLLIRPFILRRSKMEVAKDLPALTEQIRYCGMAKQQQNIYEREKSAIRNELLKKMAVDGVAGSSMQILQGLNRLRQLANHPAMLDVENDGKSGKFEAITESLRELVQEKHKVLIFSSYVKHLSLVRNYLEEDGLRYSMLTGSTQNREEVISSFQENEENRVFLISLKAGGVGLNLTQADYVFILDPWWNPAAEMQAIARAHRIGQENKVMVYRFITEGSIEEKIIGMQERKSNLADKFVNSNNPFKNVTHEEIMSLFS